MIASGASQMILGYWWPSMFPGIALGLTVFSFAAAGEAVGRLVEPHGAAVTGVAAREEVAVSYGPLAPAPVTAGFAGPTHGAPESEVIEAMTPVTPPPATANAVRAKQAGVVDHGMDRPEECLLEIENLSVDFGDGEAVTRAVSDVSLWVAAGETFGIVGESGSGKSVLVRAALRLLPEEGHVAQGEVRYRGQNILQMEPDELRRLRGVEFAPILPSAKLQLSPVTRVEDLVVLVYQAHAKGDRKTAVARAVEALRLVGIQDPERRLKAYPHELSGGMAQRVCIALALLHNPRLVIADEPTSGLDVTVQRQVLDEMVAAARERGAAQMIVTRDVGIVAQYCQRMAVMHGGRIIETGYTMDVFRDPQHPYTQRLLDAAVITTTRGVGLPAPTAEATAVPG
jgi:ABC-type dipeptide/oligopeptide/nickel transport system ATPase component